MNRIATALALMTISNLVLGYDEIYDKIDVDKILADEALFDAYIDCMLDKGPCTAEHSPEFRKLLPEVVATACAKCTPIQKAHVNTPRLSPISYWQRNKNFLPERGAFHNSNRNVNGNVI
nr:Ejaculatory bulb-specific protein 3 [Metisa plana]